MSPTLFWAQAFFMALERNMSPLDAADFADRCLKLYMQRAVPTLAFKQQKA